MYIYYVCIYIDIYMITHTHFAWNGRAERWPYRVSFIGVQRRVNPSI